LTITYQTVTDSNNKLGGNIKLRGVRGGNIHQGKEKRVREYRPKARDKDQG
jgi:hypothetical protein